LSDDTAHTSASRGLRGRLWDALPGSGRTRTVLVIGAVLLAVLVFLVVPGVLAAQPQFYAGKPATQTYYATWAKSVHAEVPCAGCHVAPDWASQLVYGLRLPGEFYLAFLAPTRPPALLKVPTNPACQTCHVDLRKVSPSGDLNIPHRAHVTVLKLQCVTCHTYLVHKKNPQGNDKPTMATCLTCHNGRTAKNSCSACHTEKALPASHRAADWVTVHAQMQKKIDCTKCHAWTKDWCAQCHSTRPRSHTKTWRLDHAAAVAKHRNCETCHQAAFCIRCHGEVPQQNFDPKMKPVQ
jgi:hypothetical protein